MEITATVPEPRQLSSFGASSNRCADVGFSLVNRGTLQREQGSKSPFVFVSERGTPFSTRGFQAMVERAARAARFDMKIHPHMLRHAAA
jgi:site-specific recombinase XerD